LISLKAAGPASVFMKNVAMEVFMKRLLTGTRVLVADGSKAMVFRNAGDAQAPNLKLEKSYGQDNPPTRDQGSDKPGRTNDPLGRRSAMETTDWHRQAEDRFIQRLAADMAADLSAGAYDKLVVAAPPVALGTMRKAMSAAVLDTITCEIGKDLTKHPVAEIEKAVTKALAEA
jgi:protein required for attachment to host cells